MANFGEMVANFLLTTLRRIAKIILAVMLFGMVMVILADWLPESGNDEADALANEEEFGNLPDRKDLRAAAEMRSGNEEDAIVVASLVSRELEMHQFARTGTVRKRFGTHCLMEPERFLVLVVAPIEEVEEEWPGRAWKAAARAVQRRGLGARMPKELVVGVQGMAGKDAQIRQGPLPAADPDKIPSEGPVEALDPLLEALGREEMENEITLGEESREWLKQWLPEVKRDPDGRRVVYPEEA